jgi:hypothetical protein
MNEDRDEIQKIIDLIQRLKKPNASMAMPKKWRGLIMRALALSSQQRAQGE